MAERTVKVNLKADVSEYTASLARAAAQTRGLSDSVETEFKRTETKAKASGERTGGTLARGINQGLIRNSPLIVAGVAGALSAGAPVAIAGATALFGGIGAVAAAQTQEIRRSWTQLGQQIRDGAIADASYVVPVFSRMATDLAATFEDLRPQLRAAFIALAPQIDTFTDSLTKAATTAVPALVRAVQNGQPVMDGLAHLVETIGQGLADFFDAVSSHSQAAGTALAAIGDIVGQLLPIIGEFLGTGVELASVVLPPLAKALGVVADVLQVLEPILPGIVGGFAAFKAITSLTGPIENLASKLGGLGGGLSTFAGMLGPIGVGVGIAVAQFQMWQAQLESWGQALAEGGRSAAQATQQIRELEQAGAVLGSGAQGVIGNLTGYSFALNSMQHASEGAAQAQKDYEASLNPVEQAQLRVQKAQDAVNQAIADHGRNSPQAIAAVAAYKQAQADLAYQEGQTELAIDGVTQAMIDQYNQALAATNSSFAYRDAQNSVEDAQNHLIDVQNHLNDSNEQTRTSTEDVQRAGLQLEEALLRQATAAGQLASDALPASATELDHNTASAQGTLAELYKLRDQMGDAFPASLQQTIKNLESTGVRLDTTSGQAQNLTNTVNGVPTFIGIHVDADLGPAEAKLNAFIQRHWTAIISSNVEGSGTTGGGGTTKRLAAGGFVSGPGTSTSDSIPALLSDGEFVVNAAATRQNRRLLESMNARRFANGGAVSKDWTSILYDADMSGAEAGMLAARKAAGALLGAISLAGVQTTGPVQDIVRSVASRFGWGSGSEWNALAWLIQHESGWRPTAQNPTSTAYGLFQFLNSTWASVGGHKTSDPALQSQYGLTYIRNRYGDPLGAQRFWQAHHWYANGGVINEPIAGLGLSSGDRYMFGERGPEMVTPMGLTGTVSGGGAPPVVIDVSGAEVAGRIEVGADGLMRFVDGRIVSLATAGRQSTQYGATR